jgi:hypothetical protein
MAPDGVLRNGTLRAGGEAGASAVEARQAGTVGGFPMTGGVGGAGRSGERTRDVALLEGSDLWTDETQVSPRVLGRPDRGDEDHRT